MMLAKYDHMAIFGFEAGEFLNFENILKIRPNGFASMLISNPNLVNRFRSLEGAHGQLLYRLLNGSSIQFSSELKDGEDKRTWRLVGYPGMV